MALCNAPIVKHGCTEEPWTYQWFIEAQTKWQSNMRLMSTGHFYWVASHLWFYPGVNICTFWTVDCPLILEWMGNGACARGNWSLRDLQSLSCCQTGPRCPVSQPEQVHWSFSFRTYLTGGSCLQFLYWKKSLQWNATSGLHLSAARLGVLTCTLGETVWMDIWWRYKWAFMKYMYKQIT